LEEKKADALEMEKKTHEKRNGKESREIEKK